MSEKVLGLKLSIIDDTGSSLSEYLVRAFGGRYKKFEEGCLFQYLSESNDADAGLMFACII